MDKNPIRRHKSILEIVMNKNVKENQLFKSFDVISILILLSMGIFFYSYPINQHLNKKSAQESKGKAEILGYQLAQIYRDQKLEQSSQSKRGPASANSEKFEFKNEGFIGADAEGRPFKYKIQEVGPNSVRVILTNKQDTSNSKNDSDEVSVDLVIPLNPST
jgi:hypothetical protein